MFNFVLFSDKDNQVGYGYYLKVRFFLNDLRQTIIIVKMILPYTN